MVLPDHQVGTFHFMTWHKYSWVGSGLGASDFAAQMSGIKLWKGDENLRPVHKKPFYEIICGCLHFRLFGS
jgi:hypothetical protein